MSLALLIKSGELMNKNIIWGVGWRHSLIKFKAQNGAMFCCLLGSRATVNDAVAYMDVGKGREQDAVALRRESSCSPSY